MTRLRSAPLAILAVLVSAGAVAAVTTPSAASKGLAIATQHAGRTVPAAPAPATTGLSLAPTVDPDADAAADLPDAASHGAVVSAVAQAEDTTPDTNHGADVSAVARQNHGQTEAATHRPADAGKPDGVGKPADAGKPDDPGAPDGAGRP
jgi:hypothetical protein